MLFLLTGGTIDKMPVYLQDGETFDNDLKVFGETHLPEMLDKARFLGKRTVQTLFMIDSLDMTYEYRKQINTVIEETDETQIVITHGTDTMPETARYLDGKSRLAAKTIVLTGAMVPYSVGESSDAMFNLGNAIAFAQALPSGVYVTMNGQAFEASNVRKDLDSGTFKTLE